MNDYLRKIENSEVDYLKKSRKSNEALLSVVIPTYRRGKLLEEALYSAISQSKKYENVEVIVLSNDPADDLNELIKKYDSFDFTVIRNNINLGMCGNINKCLFVANGKYLAYLHDDDLLTPDYFETMLTAISEYRTADAIIPARYLLFGDSEWGKKMESKAYLKSIVSRLFIKKGLKCSNIYRITVEDIYRTGRNCFSAPTCGTVFNRMEVIREGGFPQDWKYAFDLIFYNDFCQNHEVLLLKRPLGVYRMVESASNEAKVQLEFFDAQKYLLDRNRNIPIVKEYYYEYLHLFAMGLSLSARELIDAKYGDKMTKWKVVKYKMLRLYTQVYYYASGIEAERFLKKK